jgi:hypothetical protein
MLVVPFDRDDVADQSHVRSNLTIDLLSAWPGGFAFGTFAAGPARVFLKFVGAI